MTPALNRLIEAFTLLPGMGKRTAQRTCMYLLQRNREAMVTLAQALMEASERIGQCRICRTYSEEELCSLCADSSRDNKTLCVVETVADQMAIEQQGYRGRYFVLHGCLSPLDGIGPEQLGLEQLQPLHEDGEQLEEVILATNATVEGEATACWLAEKLAAPGVRLTRIASGIPMGGEIEYLDDGTVAMALHGRRPFSL